MLTEPFKIEEDKRRLATNRLASGEHIAERRLLRGRDGQVVVALDSNPRLGVRAVEACEGGLPLIRALVTLGAVLAEVDCPQLRSLDVVGESLALRGCPF